MFQLNESLESLKRNVEIKDSRFLINDIYCHIYYHRVLSDIKLFHQHYTEKINLINMKRLDEIYPGVFFKLSLLENINFVNNGFIFLIFEESFYLINLQNNFNRSVQDSLIDPTNLDGPRDGFIESIDTNIALIQKRVKSSSLKIETMQIGVRSKTIVSLVYINDICQKDNIKFAKEKLNKINTDAISSIKDIAYLFSKNSLFPKCAEVGSPDIASVSLYEGRLLILIDNFPVAIVAPTDFNYFITLKESNYNSPFMTLFYKVFFFMFLFLSVFSLGLYVAMINYHSEALSLIMISQIKASFKGSTMPLIVEFIFILFLFDALRLASTKAPKNNIQSVIIIVGGLLIGQNAVDSGFISSFNLVVTAICYLSSYVLTNNQKFIQALSILRIIVFLAGMFLGIYGVLLVSIIIIHFLTRSKSINTSYLSPVIPYYKKDFAQMFLSKRIYKKKTRNKNLNPIDDSRGNL